MSTRFGCIPQSIQQVFSPFIAYRFSLWVLCLVPCQPGAVAYVRYYKNLELSNYGNYFLQYTWESVVWYQTNDSTKFERSWIQSMQVSEQPCVDQFFCTPLRRASDFGKVHGAWPPKMYGCNFWYSEQVFTYFLKPFCIHFTYKLPDVTNWCKP